MSEIASIELSSVPAPLVAGALRRVDSKSGDRVIAFNGCPVIGREVGGDEIEFSFPRAIEIRESLIDWMLYWGIPFRVMP
ncbi:hypothetical protein [Burkholderia cenocepacia]|uniref:hypothetical protein n=1 Tax=Burkholderia cenocepacia TaxID=95486 RepID=UPI00158B7537|nr:hypothetical protein [Burkholderia cenocepacia]